MEFIDNVEVYLNATKNTLGIYCIHSVISYDIEGNEIINYSELSYADEFNGSDGSDYEQEIIEYVALKVGVDKDIVVIKGYI